MVAQTELAAQLGKQARKVERPAGPIGIRNRNKAGPKAFGLFSIARPQYILAVSKRVVVVARRCGLEVEAHQSHAAKELQSGGVAGVAFVTKFVGAAETRE